MHRHELGVADLIFALATAIDLVDNAVADHHLRVTYIADQLARELNYTADARKDLAIAAGLHDIGALTLKDRMDTLRFEMENPHRHSELGYRFLVMFAPFTRAAEIIRYHHVPLHEQQGELFNGNPVSEESHLLFLADRLDVAVRNSDNVITRTDGILAQLEQGRGTLFVPKLVDALLRITQRESFWLDLVSPRLEIHLRQTLELGVLNLNQLEMVELARLLSRTVDFRSTYTSTHTAGVAATAVRLAHLAGMQDAEIDLLEIAGYLHDLGKLAVPIEILDKPAVLDKEEYSFVKRHAFQTRRILEQIGNLEDVAVWASAHHERLDGRGYPFGSNADELPLPSRILAVADVFTAIAEDRPYREGMEQTEVLDVLNQMSDDGKLDHDMVVIVTENYQSLDSVRKSAQEVAAREYAASVYGF